MKVFSERNLEVAMSCAVVLTGLVFLFCIFSKWKVFFSDYQGVFTFFGSLAAFITLLFALHQIKATKDQIKAGFVYEILRDGDRVIDGLDFETLQYIKEAPETKIQEPDQNTLKYSIEKVFRYYSSLERQYEYERIDRNEWELIVSNLSAFLNKPVVKEYYDKEVKGNPSWNEGFKCLAESCFQIEGGKK